ncbi:hypothetical protein DFA_06163 [Cavenderia fasciculata]|uniref:Calponin-homology (CH) domain-containing protein n=1 Tax=Cavenderia fasciculata TaxID=261658 RepID=F4PKA1_CACFS|nr:uncharacterized protein DFA_06163 [Cavenderia fasciculata]EGG24025.1 hypothetical protein DFA_06163 [Cavenderia fasciculata]|eukprot:XP_004361876.1 hypothetical protein DFA_06163 [Cavenderia fasciculata]
MATKVVANSTAGQAVFRGDGIRVYGLDAELELKAQSKRDPQYEKELGKWIEGATGMKLEYQDDLIESLRSGIVLCTLVNILLPETIKKINVKPIPLMQVENLTMYLKACWKIGVPSSDLFVTSDLYQKKNINSVLQNLASLARASHNCPAYKGPSFGLKPSVAPPVKKWAEIKIGQPIMITDLEAEGYGSSNNSSANTSMKDFCVSCGTQKSCNKCDHVDTEIITFKQQVKVLEKEKEDLVVKIDRLLNDTSSRNGVSDKEKQVMESKIDTLNQMIKDQSFKVQSLHDTIESQKKQFNLKEVELKLVIDKQKLLLDQKEIDLNSLKRNSTSTVVTPTTNSTQPTTTTTTTTVESNPFKRNTVQFNQPPVQNAKSTFGGVVVSTTNECIHCKHSNSKLAKYCTSCGKELVAIKSQTTIPNQLNINNQPNNNNNNVPTKEQIIESIWFKSLNKEKDELGERLKSMLVSMKQYEDTVAKLSRSLADEKQSMDKRILEQKQIIDQQERQLQSKDREIKQFNNNNINNNKSTTPPLPSTNNVSGSFIRDGEKRFTVQLNTGLNRGGAGPGTYNNRDRSETSPPLYSTNNNNNNNNNLVRPTSPTLLSSPSSSTSTGEIEKLKLLLKQMESNLQEEKNKSKLKDATIQTLEQKLQTIQSRPRPRRPLYPNEQPQQPQQHHIMVGRKRFNTLTADTLDNRLVEDTFKCVNNILFSRPVEFYEVSSLNDLFKTEQGRRRFSQILHVTLKQVQNIVLSESSFEFLLYLVNTTLQQMDISKDTDNITAKIMLHASNSLYRICGNGEQEYIKDYIRSAQVWQNIRLWEDYFYELLAKRHRKRYDNAVDKVDNEIVSNLLSYFAVNMVHFQVPLATIQTFLTDLAKFNGLSQSEANTILEFLKQSSNKQKVGGRVGVNNNSNNSNNNNNNNNNDSWHKEYNRKARPHVIEILLMAFQDRDTRIKISPQLLKRVKKEIPEHLNRYSHVCYQCKVSIIDLCENILMIAHIMKKDGDGEWTELIEFILYNTDHEICSRSSDIAFMLLILADKFKFEMKKININSVICNSLEVMNGSTWDYDPIVETLSNDSYFKFLLPILYSLQGEAKVEASVEFISLVSSKLDSNKIKQMFYEEKLLDILLTAVQRPMGYYRDRVRDFSDMLEPIDEIIRPHCILIVSLLLLIGVIVSCGVVASSPSSSHNTRIRVDDQQQEFTEEDDSTSQWFSILESSNKIVSGKFVKGSSASGYYKDDVMKDGWGKLSIETVSGDDSVIFEAAGYLEGYLTWQHIYNFTNNYYAGQFNTTNPKEFPASVWNYVIANYEWTVAQVKANPSDTYWQQVNNSLLQLNGLVAGYNSAADDDKQFTFMDFVMVNLIGDIGDIVAAVNGTNTEFAPMSRTDVEKYMATTGRCSALVKVTPDFSDLFVAHTTWGSYYNMLRIFKHLQPNTLWIIEQMPGACVSADVTNYLALGYWPSYNRPFFPEVFEAMGYPWYLNKYGDIFSYQLNPRSNIFRRDQSSVYSLTDMQAIMTSNMYRVDPFSDGYPGNAIASRYDLGGGPPILDWYYKGAHGAIDSKITSSSLVPNLECVAISGPPVTGDCPPFSWSNGWENIPHDGLPNTFDFPWVPIKL